MSPPNGYPPLPDPLPLPVTDSHCHLDEGRDGAPLPVAEALALAASVGVTAVVHVGCDLPAAARAVDLARAHKSVSAAVALHPTTAAQTVEREGAEVLDAALDRIADLAALPEVVAVGETGLDHYWTPPGAGRDVQEHTFRAHIELAKRVGKPLVIHDRDAHEDVVRVLLDAGPPDRVVFHCFSGDVELVRLCARYGWFVSFAGTLTFANALPLRRAAAEADHTRVLVETDSPYLAPHPYRGRPSSPYLVPVTVRALRDATGRTTEATCLALAAATELAFA